jgi:gas vesicle protein
VANETDNTSRVVWFVAGAAIGAAIALLYAPASGEVTRRKLRRTAEEGRSKLVEGGKEMLDRGRDLYDKGRKIADEAAELFERGREAVQKASSVIGG